MPVIEWFVEDEQRQALEPYVGRALRYLPPWVQSVNIRYDPNERNIASVGVMPEYRTASIRMGNGWFSETADERLVTLIHEVLHAHIETLAVVFGDLLGALLPDATAPLRVWADEQWRRAEEGVCTDLSRLLAAAEQDRQ